MPNDTRLDTLEFKVAHLERALQDLSDALYQQQQRLDDHDARYRHLLDQIESAAERAQAAPKFEVPPHY